MPPPDSPATGRTSIADHDMRIGYVLKRYPRFSETFVVNEILAHERAGVHIDIFALGPVEETHFQDAIARVRAAVTRLPERARAAADGWPLLMRAHRELPELWRRLPRAEGESAGVAWQAVAIALEAKARGIRLLHAHFGTQAASVARLAAAFAGIPYTLTAHAKDIFHAYEEPTRLDLKLREAAAAITVSDFNLDHLRHTYGSDAAGVVRLYNGLDLQQFAYTPPRQRPPHLLGVGRLVAKKGFPVLIDALALLRARAVDFHCTLIGDGPQRDMLAARIADLDLGRQVTLAGARAQPDVKATLREAAMLVAPCIVSDSGDRDGLPTVLVEAMALGTPCISTRVAGIPELVRDDDTGLCVAADDPSALAQAIQRLLEDPALGLRLAASARELVERDFDLERNAAEQRTLFAKAIAATASYAPPDAAEAGA